MGVQEARPLISKDTLANTANLTELVDGSETTLHSHAGGGFTSKCSVYLSSDQTLTTGTWTKILFDTEVYDIDGEFDNATNYRFTATVAGYYHISAKLYLELHVPGNLFYCMIYKNGALFTGASFDADAYPQPVATQDVYLAINDFIEIFGWQGNGVNKNVGGDAGISSTFTIHRFT